MPRILPDYFRNAIFGVEDSLVSTVGVLFGVASSVADRQIVLLMALVVISVEALSMGVGSYLSEKSAHQMLRGRDRVHRDKPGMDGLIMFLSYSLAGFIPTVPYLLAPVGSARYFSVAVSILALFTLGYASNQKLRGAWEMVILGGAAIGVGFLASLLIQP